MLVIFFSGQTLKLASNRTPQTAPRAFFQLCINEQKFQSNLTSDSYQGLGHTKNNFLCVAALIKSVPDFVPRTTDVVELWKRPQYWGRCQ